MNSIELSIIIVNYNTKKLTLDAVKSVVNSKPKVKYEIIVVDNGSSEQFDVKAKDFKLIRNEENLGFAKANNIGIEEAKGKYIFLLNSDTVVKNHAIDRLYEFAKEKEDVGVVVPRLLNTDGSIQGSVFRLPTIGNAIGQYLLGKKGLFDKYAPNEKEIVTVEAAVMAAFLITPKAMEKVGKLNEKYFMYFEDLDYCRAIKAAGLKIYYLPAAEVTHIHGGSGGKMEYLIAASKKYHGDINHYIINSVIWLGQKIERLGKIK